MKAGQCGEGFERVMGPHGVGNVNDGERLKEFCDFNEMVIMGTIFQHRVIHEETWTSPNRRTKNSD